MTRERRLKAAPMITLRELGARCGLSANVVGKIETGVIVGAGGEVIARIEAALKALEKERNTKGRQE